MQGSTIWVCATVVVIILVDFVVHGHGKEKGGFLNGHVAKRCLREIGDRTRVGL